VSAAAPAPRGGQVALDLTPALKDAYLRKVAHGPGGEPFEASFHVLRIALGSRQREADRLYGLRFGGVRGVAGEATRWDRDAAKFVSARFDWLGALARGDLEPPIIGAATLGGADTIERLGKAADEAVWLRGDPGAIAGGSAPIAAAPVLFEASGEAILPNGWNANIRLFVASDRLEVIGSRGPVAPEELIRQGELWSQKWRDYWHRKQWKPELSDPQFEWCAPERDDRD
jgi:hypothetical protein